MKWGFLLLITLTSCAVIDKFFGGDPGPAPMHDLIDQGGDSPGPMFRRVVDGGVDGNNSGVSNGR
jgi:hypothetical protein